MEQKEHAIQEYKGLIENLRITTAQSRTTDEDSGYKSQELIKLTSREEETRLKTSAELINNLQLEEKERQIHSMEHQIRDLEDANAELGEQLAEALTNKPSKKEVGVQVKIDVLSSA